MYGQVHISTYRLKAQKVVSEKLCISVVGSEDMLQYLAYCEYETCKEFQMNVVAVFKA